MDYSIVWVRGHVEVYDWAGRFCFCADNEREAREALLSPRNVYLGVRSRGAPFSYWLPRCSPFRSR